MNTEFPLRHPEILLEKIGEEAFLYNPANDALHVLNSTAVTVWNRCDGRHSIEDIGTCLRTIWQCPEDTKVEADVRDIVNSFVDLGVLS